MLMAVFHEDPKVREYRLVAQRAKTMTHDVRTMPQAAAHHTITLLDALAIVKRASCVLSGFWQAF
jgi:hypothetical protein